MKLTLNCALALLPLSGCGSLSNVAVNPMEWWSGPVEQAPEQLAGATRYLCDANKRFAVRFGTPAKSVMVIFPDREFRLDPVAAASGARYSNGRTTLNTRGDEIFLEEDGAIVFANCKRAA